MPCRGGGDIFNRRPKILPAMELCSGSTSALPCASPRSEHGILGKRRVKLRSPAVGRATSGCQPDEQFRPRLSGTLWSAAVRVRGSRAQRRGRGTTELTSTAREPVKLGTGVNGTYLRPRLPSTLMGPWTRAPYFELVILRIQMMLSCGGRCWN